MLGPLTEHQRELFMHNPRFLGMKLPEIGRPETLARRYHGKVCSSQLNLMKGLLEMDENTRIDIDTAQQHIYFDSLKNNPNLTYPGYEGQSLALCMLPCFIYFIFLFLIFMF